MELIINRDVEMMASDDTRLASDVYTPADGGPFPTLIHRTPYGKRNTSITSTLMVDPVDAVERGYAVVVQDARGTGASEGMFVPLAHERADGHDLIEWTLSQDWCNGSVGLYGSSYMGATALQAAVDAPTAVKAVAAYLTGSNYHQTWVYTGGVFEFGYNFRWALGMVATALAEERRTVSDREAVVDELTRFASDPIAFFSTSLDLRKVAPAALELMPWIEDYLDHPRYDDYWSRLDLVAAADRIRMPVFTIAGWYDAFGRSQLDFHRSLLERSPARAHHRLRIGPWEHLSYLGSQTTARSGTRNFGPSATSGRNGLQESVLAFLDQWLQDGATSPVEPVRYFHIGPNVWRDVEVWPPKESHADRWFLHGSGTRGGTLDGSPPVASATPSSYTYDPLDPAPTHGGRHLMYDLPSGVADQRHLQNRADVLSFTSAHLVEPLVVKGTVTAQLWVRSSAPVTDFVVVLSRVHPDGFVENVLEGVAKVEFSNAMPSPPAEEIAIDLWDMAYTFDPGSQIRLSVTSSSFPRFERSRNVALDAPADAYAVAFQQVLHDEDHPSCVVLPVWPSPIGSTGADAR